MKNKRKKLKPGCLLRTVFPDEIFQDDEKNTTAFWESNYDVDSLTWEGFAIETYDRHVAPPIVFVRNELSIPVGTRGLMYLEEQTIEHYPEDGIYYKVLYGEKECWVMSDDVVEIAGK